LTAELSDKIDAFLRRAHCYGLAANILTVSELFDSVAQDFFPAKSNRLTIVFILCYMRRNLESSITPSWTSVPASHVCL